MIGNFRLTIAQLNPIVGDIEGNLTLARTARAKAAVERADLILFTELFICGYWPSDIVLKPAFIYACEKAIHELKADTKDGGPGVIIGLPIRHGNNIYNAVVLLDKGEIIDECYKIDLPNYGEFDEKRVFTPGDRLEPVIFRGLSLGLLICEDIWNNNHHCKKLAEKGAQLILVANASSFSREKPRQRSDVLSRQVRESGLPIVYANQFGGQDELVFDGGSFALTTNNSLAFQMKHFQEDIAITIWEKASSGWNCVNGPFSCLFSGLEADYNACMVGLADYVKKNGFQKIILGLSGGIDSALCAAIAVDALGAECVHTIMLPYRYTSQSSCDDAALCARLLGCRYDVISISKLIDDGREALEFFFGALEGVTEENLQSRMRGIILMAISNKFNAMVLTTGNKSEMAVGYATLYGDMNGGFNPIKDLYKMQVYALSEWRNVHKPENGKGPVGLVIPQSILDRIPSAELREGQADEDSLPSYPVLDDVLECLIERDMSVEEIISRGRHDRATIERIEHLLYVAEYKRRQSAPGVKVSMKSLGRDRWYPITNRFRTTKYFPNLK